MSRPPRTERVPVAMAEPTAGMQWLRDFRLSGFALTILLLVVAALVMLAPQLKTLVEQRQQIALLQQEVDTAADRLEHIDAEVARWSDRAYIEAQARDRLFYVYPGDTSYLVLGGDTSPLVPTPDVPITDDIQTGDVDWIDALLSSVYTAGLTTSPHPDDTPAVDSPAQEGTE